MDEKSNMKEKKYLTPEIIVYNVTMNSLLESLDNNFDSEGLFD